MLMSGRSRSLFMLPPARLSRRPDGITRRPSPFAIVPDKLSRQSVPEDVAFVSNFDFEADRREHVRLRKPGYATEGYFMRGTVIARLLLAFCSYKHRSDFRPLPI